MRARNVQSLLWLLSITAAVTVANLYYSQPLLALIGATFGAGAHQTGLVPTLSQAGYGAGILLLVPLGDAVERRRLIVLMTFAATALVLAVGLAPNLPALLAANFLLGAATCVPQLAIPYAAGIVEPAERGRSIGKVMAGLLVGILISRTVSGFVGAHAGWRTIYIAGFVVMALLGVLLRFLLPRQDPEHRTGYAELLRSLPSLVASEPLLRRHALLGALAFAAFSAFWTTLVFLLRAPPHHFGADVAGLFGIVGVAGALAAPVVGKLADKHGSRLVNGIALGCVLASWIVFALLWRSLAGIALGVILLDVGVQANHISNQTRILGLSAPFRNRLNTVYMVTYFTGGAFGSYAGAAAFASAGWAGTSAFGITISVLALAAFFGVERRAALVAEPSR